VDSSFINHFVSFIQFLYDFDRNIGWCVEMASGLDANADMAVADAVVKVGLLSSELDYYVLKEKWWDWGGGDIYDQSGKVVGKMHRRVISMRELTEVMDSGGSQVFTINKKLVSMRASYMIKDPEGHVLGRTNRKILTLFRPKLWLEDDGGQKLLEANGNFLGKSFDIKDNGGILKAKVGKSDFFKDLVFGGLFDFSDTYAIKVLDPNYDKRLLLGFVVAIDNSVHDK
jgi:uncharacterized protein YxjI